MVVVVLLGYISYDISSDGHLARAVGAQNRLITRPFLGTADLAPDWTSGCAVLLSTVHSSFACNTLQVSCLHGALRL